MCWHDQLQLLCVAPVHCSRTLLSGVRYAPISLLLLSILSFSLENITDSPILLTNWKIQDQYYIRAAYHQRKCFTRSNHKDHGNVTSLTYAICQHRYWRKPYAGRVRADIASGLWRKSFPPTTAHPKFIFGRIWYIATLYRCEATPYYTEYSVLLTPYSFLLVRSMRTDRATSYRNTPSALVDDR